MKIKKPLQKRKYSGVQADLRTEERKQKIIEAGLEAFGTIGYAKTSIKKICTLAGLTERYFYESFPCKEDLLSTVYRSITEELISKTIEITDNFKDKSVAAAQETLKRYLQTLQDDPRKARILFFEILGVSPRIDREYQKAIQILSDHAMKIMLMVFPALDYHRLKDTILPAAIAGAIIQVASQWTLNHFQPPLEKILSQAASLFQLAEVLVGEKTDFKNQKKRVSASLKKKST